MIYTKKELFKKHYFLPEAEMRNTINEIIAKNRDLEISVAKYKKNLRPIEVKKFMEVYDLI